MDHRTPTPPPAWPLCFRHQEQDRIVSLSLRLCACLLRALGVRGVTPSVRGRKCQSEGLTEDRSELYHEGPSSNPGSLAVSKRQVCHVW